MSSKTEELQFAIIEARAAVEKEYEDPSSSNAMHDSCPIKLPPSPIQFLLGSLSDDKETKESPMSVCGKAKSFNDKKLSFQLRKFFYPKFKRRACGTITLGPQRHSVKKQEKNLSSLQVACTPEALSCTISSCVKNMGTSNKKSGVPHKILIEEVVSCESPSNFVRNGYLSSMVNEEFSPKECTATPIPYNGNFAFRLTESPLSGDIPRLCFTRMEGKQDKRTTSRFVPGPNCLTEVVLCSSKSNDLNPSNQKEPQICNKEVWVNEHEKENVPLGFNSNGKVGIVYRNLQKGKKRRNLSPGQAISISQVSHGICNFLKTRSRARLDLDTCSREMAMAAGPVLRSALTKPLLNVGIRKDLKLVKDRTLSAYGWKKSLVKALLERYLRNRRLKWGTPNRRDVCLPFLNHKANRRVECFHCKASVAPHELTMCGHKGCNRSYHRTCAQNLEDFHFRKNGDRVCPQHACMVCKGFHRAKVFRCERCIVAAHKKCMPFCEHAVFWDSKPNSFICWRHPQDWRLESEYKVPTADTKEVFKRLPVPYAPLEFSIGAQLPEEVSGKGQEPAPFIQIRRNIFLVQKKRDDTDDGVGCACKDLCHDGCECRAQSMSCSRSCICNEKCGNKPFRREKRIKLAKTLACGWGVQSKETIMKGEFIIEYVGEVINEAMCEERLWTLKERGDHNFYMCEIGKDFIIDATFKGNFARFINHSCNPNCILEKWRVDGEIRVGIFAARDITEGEALTYDYRFVQFGPTVRCRCGSLNCRGNLGETYQNKKTKQPRDATANPVQGSSNIPVWGERHRRSHKSQDL